MIDRGIYLKDALTLYQGDEEYNIHKEDLLTKDDWYELCQFRDLLEPIHELSLLVQSVGTTAGALHNKPLTLAMNSQGIGISMTHQKAKTP